MVATLTHYPTMSLFFKFGWSPCEDDTTKQLQNLRMAVEQPGDDNPDYTLEDEV